MTIQVAIDDVVVLESGKVLVAITIPAGKPVVPGMVGSTPSGGVEIEVTSVALSNSSPAARINKAYMFDSLEGQSNV